MGRKERLISSVECAIGLWAFTVRKSFFQNTIALVYDFDGTLSPQPMQEYTVLPKIGVEPAQFWAAVNREARETESDMMLVYMRHIIEALELKRVDVKREDFAQMAGAIEYFPGVTTWFSSTRSSLACEDSAKSPISSMNSDPP